MLADLAKLAPFAQMLLNIRQHRFDALNRIGKRVLLGKNKGIGIAQNIPRLVVGRAPNHDAIHPHFKMRHRFFQTRHTTIQRKM